jgi:thiamine pyrophosphate-dependent acetolactate synthase large subunit-like protein
MLHRPVIHLVGESAIGFSGMEMETLVRDNWSPQRGGSSC